MELCCSINKPNAGKGEESIKYRPGGWNLLNENLKIDGVFVFLYSLDHKQEF